LLEKVAVRGDAQALEYLGGHYAHGTGCQKDLVLAFVFFQLAERVAQRQTFERKLPWVRRQIFPTERFELNLSWVGGQISPSERAEAQSIADSWVPGMPLPVRTRRP
jgi:hypothetical protein